MPKYGKHQKSSPPHNTSQTIPDLFCSQLLPSMMEQDPDLVPDLHHRALYTATSTPSASDLRKWYENVQQLFKIKLHNAILEFSEQVQELAQRVNEVETKANEIIETMDANRTCIVNNQSKIEQNTAR
ncbi:hypothetical protein GDO78_019371 [Eleutherodactylus coqui]|uniref:Uncharacterized protein n=1 Tax=Eleutherodactylus coqui TaxID=57060 RepID=A0A8J6JQD9_ELECQ|nr:hypothetical protein GDO78_019371 [Eleutherodactylus coqui]